MKNLPKLAADLGGWYIKNRRDLPWRKHADAYLIWISEIMLQQTTVKAVLPYYEKFISEFPTVRDLAQAEEERVLGLWSGLGYYSRAKNLHAAAKEIVALGKFPDDYCGLLELPGIGPYTPAAIASIAFGENVAAVDGNVIRVVTRLFDIAENVAAREVSDKIRIRAQSLMQGRDPSVHNQAMMELGATICLPKNPACLLCPVSSFCESRRRGTVEMRPVKSERRRREIWTWDLTVLRKRGRVALVKNENGSPWLKNTWVLPGVAKRWAKEDKPKFDFRHSITHHDIYVRLKNQLPKGSRFALKWVSPGELSRHGVSSIVQKALDH